MNFLRSNLQQRLQESLNILHEYVTVKNLQDGLNLCTLSANQQRLAAIERIQVSLDLSLRIQNKRINTLPHGQITNVIRDHAIQPPHPVSSGQRNQTAVNPIKSAAVNHCPEFALSLDRAACHLLIWCNNSHTTVIIAKQLRSLLGVPLFRLP